LALFHATADVVKITKYI